MAQYPRVKIHLEMTSTDLRAPYDELFDVTPAEMQERGRRAFEQWLNVFFGAGEGTEVNITRLDVEHDLEERVEAAA